MEEIFTANFPKVIGSVIDVLSSIKKNPSLALISSASSVVILMAWWNVLTKLTKSGPTLSVSTGIQIFTLPMKSKRPILEVNLTRSASSFYASAARNQELELASSVTLQIVEVLIMLDAQFVAISFKNGKRWSSSSVTLNWKTIILFLSSVANIERMATKTSQRNRMKRKRWNQRVRRILQLNPRTFSKLVKVYLLKSLIRLNRKRRLSESPAPRKLKSRRSLKLFLKRR
jgi:hypothetical protein